MTLIHLAAGTVAGLIGVFARSVLRIEEDHPRPVRDHVCFVTNRLHDELRESLSSDAPTRGKLAFKKTATHSVIDLDVPCDAALFSQQLTILQQSLQRENVPVVTGVRTHSRENRRLSVAKA